jgi:valyl-tRNA synthetase
MSELPKGYEPRDVEPRWYKFWQEHDVFAASTREGDDRPVYVVSMPPPNVTGSLHMGHALMGTLEDILVRHKRMQGFNALWQPGMDHAGIATQTVVERQLAREGKSRHDLGRDAFQARIWTWKEQSGGRILEQLKALGCSADWPRLKFTMDSDMSAAVREAFVRLHEEGLIYRDTRLINWDSESQTALSDLEVESEEADGELYEFAYLVKDGVAGEAASELVVATTRPETMLGDTAVAVHPEDPRYTHLHGKLLVHPFVEREIRVITDAVLVDMAFGTGAVKVTPAHDFNDFSTGKRHGLDEVNILTLDGKINALGGQFTGLSVAEARKAVKRALAERGLERGKKPHKLQLPRSQRSGVVVEPMISTQWFLNAKPLAEKALAAVASGETEILPTEWRKTYDHWLTNIQDWCISRQLWWGHRIPAWHCKACAKITVSRNDVEKCAACGGSVEQDPDVLDTWFSSALWPFATLGWPERTPALERFYPSTDMETGYDILFFWVARMMMMGLHFMGEPPFKRVLLHGLVVDETGDKMSKVKGNTIDPLDLIHGAGFETVVGKALPGAPFDEAFKKFKKAYPSAAQMEAGFPEYGTDALRFTLVSYSPQAKRIALSPKRIEGYRHFCNKIYNAVRFALPNVEGVTPTETVPEATLLPNRWILARLARAVEASTTGIDAFRCDEGALALYQFFWNELCDWHLELTKPIFTAGSGEHRLETSRVLAHVLETALRALHPYIPFVTEELWQRIPRSASRPISLALAPYPTAKDGREDSGAENQMALLMGVITAARTIRSEYAVHPGAAIPLVLRCADEGQRALLNSELTAIQTLVKTEGPPTLGDRSLARPKGYAVSVADDVEVLVGLLGLVEASKERERLDRQIKKIDKDKEGLEKRLSSSGFVDRAPPEVVTEARAQVEALGDQRDRLTAALEFLGELES